jgi:hypothetical protein
MMNPKVSDARTEVRPHNTIGVTMEDLPEAERRALEKELEEEMAKARRRKLACFQKTRMGVIKKTILAITTMATATSMVTPNLTPEELVKFMDIAVASKYGNDLMNFTPYYHQEGTRGGDGRGEEEEARVFPKNTLGGDQENHSVHHDYGNRYIYGNS